MAATREDIDRWIDKAKENKFKFIISVCDTFDYDDYPVYCKDKDELFRVYNKYNNINMQRVNEIISIENNIVTENLNLNQIK